MMNKILSLLILFICIYYTSTSAQEKQYTEVPFIVSQTGQLLVQGTINNHPSPTYFLIEVSGRNILRSDQPQILQKYGLDTTRRSFFIDEIILGDLIVKDMRFGKRRTLAKRGEHSFPPPVIGTLGPTFFNKLAIQFDFRTMKLRIAESADKLPIPENTYNIMYRSSFQSKSIMLHLDTRLFGDKEITVSTRSPLGIHLFYSELSPVQRSKYRDVMKSYKFRLNGEDELIFGAYTMDEEMYLEHELILRDQEIWFSDHLENSIGVNFLKNYVFTIDYKKQMLYFEPINEEGSKSLSE